MKKIDQKTLDKIIENHELWLDGNGGERAELMNLDLSGLNFSNRRLNFANLDNARLNFANLDNARLDNARLDNANLNFASLNNARLDNASLNNASLNNANLNFASLNNARLNNASLDNARLDNASLDNANLNALVGNKKNIKSIFLDRWAIVYTSSCLQIGCEKHTIEKWKNFTTDEINEMDSYALEWWDKYKDLIFKIIELSPAEPTKKEDTENV